MGPGMMGGGMGGGLGMGLSGPSVLGPNDHQAPGNRFGAPAPFAVPGQQLGPGGMNNFGVQNAISGRAPPGMQMNPERKCFTDLYIYTHCDLILSTARGPPPGGLLGGGRGLGNVQDPSVLSVGSAVLGIDSSHQNNQMGQQVFSSAFPFFGS